MTTNAMVLDVELPLPEASHCRPDRAGSAPRAELIRFFRELELTRDLTGEELEQLFRALDRRDFAPGEVLLKETEPSRALFFLASGEVEVLKQDRDGGRVPLGILSRGAPFGEMSFMDGEPASATIRARTAGQVWVLSRGRLAGAAGLQHHLTRNIARTLVHRLRTTNDSYVESLQAELEHVRMRNQFGQFFVLTVVLFGIANVIPRFITQGLPPFVHMGYSWGFLLLILASILFFMRRQEAPKAAFGLTLEGWRPALREGMLLSTGIIAVGSLVRYFMLPAAEPFISWGSISSHTPLEFSVFMALYLPHCLLQEFVSRGVIQGSLERFMEEAHPIVPGAITAILFGVFHLYVSIPFALITFGVSFLFGALYLRHRNLVGVTLVHYMLGIVSLAYGFN